MQKNRTELDEYCEYNDLAQFITNSDASKGQTVFYAFHKVLELFMDGKDRDKNIRLFNESALNSFKEKYKNNENFKDYINYYKKNQIDTLCNFYKDTRPVTTIFMDEPDESLDINNLQSCYEILSSKREDIQLLCVIHNPALVYKLNKLPNINWVELEANYKQKIIDFIK